MFSIAREITGGGRALPTVSEFQLRQVPVNPSSSLAVCCTVPAFFRELRSAVSVGKGEKCKYPLECPESRHDGLTWTFLERHFAFGTGVVFLHLDGEFERATMTRIGHCRILYQ